MAEEKETYSIKEIQDVVQEQKYKYCCLTNRDGKVVVPYNRPGDKRVSATQKLQEIKKRLDALPKGIYFVVCKNSFNARVEGDSFPIAKGNVTMSEKTTERIIERNTDGKVLDYKEALALAEKAMDWQRKFETQVSLYNQLKGQYDELKTQLDNEDGLEEEPGKSFLETILPSFMPVVDKFMTQRDRELKIKEAKTALRLQEKGMMPGQNGNKKINGVKKKKINFPEPGTEEWEDFLDKLEDAEEKDFNATMLLLHQNNPEAYAVAYAELVEGEEEQEEEETEEEEQEEEA